MKVHGVLETSIYVDDLQTAVDFYRQLFEFEIMAEDQRFCAMNAGDRFGHALALGTLAQSWAKSAQILSQPREDRLDDLLWEFDRYRMGDLPGEARRVEIVRAEAESLGQRMFHTSYRVEELAESRRMRHSENWLRWVDYPRYRTIPRGKVAKHHSGIAAQALGDGFKMTILAPPEIAKVGLAFGTPWVEPFLAPAGRVRGCETGDRSAVRC